MISELWPFTCVSNMLTFSRVCVYPTRLNIDIYIYICIGCASCVYSIHVIAIHRKNSGKLKGFCFGYSQNSNVCAWGIPCFVFIVAAGCWELTYPFWKGGLKMFFLFRLSDMLPSLKLTNRPWKLLVGRLLSFWDTIFSGAMLVSGRIVCWRVYYVYIYICSVW